MEKLPQYILDRLQPEPRAGDFEIRLRGLIHGESRLVSPLFLRRPSI